MRTHSFLFVASAFSLFGSTALAAPGSTLKAITLDEDEAAATSPSTDAASEATTSEAATTEGEEPVAQPVKTAAERRKAALTAFDVGEVDVAIAGLKELLRECLELSEEECPRPTRAILYRDVGIVLADGKEDHAAAVRALRKALEAHRQIAIPDAYRSNRVMVAYEEARREVLFVPAKPVVVVDSPSDEAERTGGGGPDDRGALLHLMATPRIGLAFGNGTSETMGQFGAEALGAYVAGSGFLVGGMMHGSYEWWLDFPQLNWGTWGQSVVLGGVFDRKDSKSFHYLLGGLGFQHWPDAARTGLALQARYGASIGGLGLGLGVDLTHSNLVAGYQSIGLTEFQVGFNLGFADLFMGD